MNIERQLERAAQELETARSVLVNNPEAACSRAYYAMFYAARAALIRAGHTERAAGKSHSGVIAAFSEHLVGPGSIAREHGRAFGHAEQRRLVADYVEEGIPPEIAAEVIGKAEAFVVAVRDWVAAQAT